MNNLAEENRPLVNLNHALGHEVQVKQPIIENAVYDRNEASMVTGFSLSTLIRAEEAGKLKRRYNGRRRFYLGSDLLRWLQGNNDLS